MWLQMLTWMSLMLAGVTGLHDVVFSQAHRNVCVGIYASCARHL